MSDEWSELWDSLDEAPEWDVWEVMRQLMVKYDADIRVQTGSLCLWSGQLRATLTNPGDSPSRSMVFYATGLHSPEDVAYRLLSDYRAWRASGGQEPLTVEEVYSS